MRVSPIFHFLRFLINEAYKAAWRHPALWIFEHWCRVAAFKILMVK